VGGGAGDRGAFCLSLFSLFSLFSGEVTADNEGMDTARHFAANVADLVKKLHGGAEA
jgi:hypothetical protein